MSILLDTGIAECGVILITKCYLSVVNTFWVFYMISNDTRLVDNICYQYLASKGEYFGDDVTSRDPVYKYERARVAFH